MYKVLFLIAIFSFGACSTASKGIKFVNKSPRGISILNIKKQEHSKAYQAAEKHCAKYFKVPRIIKSTEQQDESEITLHTTVFECLKPSN